MRACVVHVSVHVYVHVTVCVCACARVCVRAHAHVGADSTVTRQLTPQSSVHPWISNSQITRSWRLGSSFARRAESTLRRPWVSRLRIERGIMQERDVIEQAAELLTAQVYCRQPAAELAACLGSGSKDCERQKMAYTTCAQSNMEPIINCLVKVAQSKCKGEVEAYARCKARSVGSDCEEEDLACMRCAAAKVLESAAM